MLFNSIDFAIFLPIVFALYWFVFNRNLRVQNVLIVVASYLFYGWWDYRFLALILFSTALDFFIGNKLSQTENKRNRKLLLATSLIVNLGFLGFFKYFNFFIENFEAAFSFFGTKLSIPALEIVLPVGISFYTFQTLSYTIDVYRRNMKAEKNFISFMAFVSFFPQLVAGPIERATNLLPQFSKKRVFDYFKAVDGLKQILWGLFKKVVIADNCAEFADLFFNNSDQFAGSNLLLGAFFFTFQIYGDFSGYSDIAIGTSRLFGFNLNRNFRFPYFSRDIAEFWRRWHISLSTWFRDYLYIPLGGSRGGSMMKIRNTFIIFIVSGFWHGANWTFIVWGALNALYFLPLLLTSRNRKNLDDLHSQSIFPSLRDFLSILLTFTLTVFAWIFFRADNIAHAFGIISEIFSNSLFSFNSFNGMNRALTTMILISVFVLLEWKGRHGEYGLETIAIHWHKAFRYLLYYSLVLIILWYSGKEQQFIYFQF